MRTNETAERPKRLRVTSVEYNKDPVRYVQLVDSGTIVEVLGEDGVTRLVLGCTVNPCDLEDALDRAEIDWARSDDPDEDRWHGETEGSFQAWVSEDIDSMHQDAVSLEFECPKGRGREFAERLLAVLGRIR